MLSCAPSALHAATSNEELASEIKALRAQIREMKSAISETRSETRRTSAKVKAVASRPYEPPTPQMAIPAGAVPAFVTADKKLQFGAITITPGGFIAAESVFRTRTVNSDVNTPFGAIPFSNSPLAHVNEFRPSARQTRLAMLAEGAISQSMLVGGYVEMDFLGAANTANSNQTNSYTPRIRNLYMTLDNSDYGMHMLAGQTWSLVTLNSKGITPRNEVTPAVIDAAQNVGSLYARQPQIRFTKDFNKKLWLSVSAEESETTIAGCGAAGTATSLTNSTGSLAGPGGIVAPNGVVTGTTCGAVGNGAFTNATTYSLNHVPDVIAKAAYEARIADRDVHFEAFGMYTNLYDRVQFTDGFSGQVTNDNKDASGYGVGGGIIVPVIPKKLDFQLNGMYGRGIGRYGPTQIAEATFNRDGSLKPIEEAIALTGVTFHATPSIDIYGYAGIETSARSYIANPATSTTSFVGVGSPSLTTSGCFSGSESTAAATACSGSTKLAYELTAGFWDKLYKGSFGEVRAGVQYSYVQRQVFSGTGVGGGGGGTSTTNFNPTVKTDEHMLFTSIRYYPFQ